MVITATEVKSFEWPPVKWSPTADTSRTFSTFWVMAAYTKHLPTHSHIKNRVLARRAQRGCQKSRDVMLAGNLRLILLVLLGKEHETVYGVHYDDAFQVGVVAMFHAIRGYKSEEASFSTYALPVIRGYILRHRTRDYLVKPPDDRPTHGLRAVQAKNARRLPHYFSWSELYALPAPDWEAEVTDCVEAIDLRRVIERYIRLAKLSFREREIVKLRFGIGDGCQYTLEETAHVFRVTRERIRQIEAKALRKLALVMTNWAIRHNYYDKENFWIR